MPSIGPIKRNDLIYFLRRFGYDGPFAGTKHSIMAKGNQRLHIPNPHHGDITTGLLVRILKQAGISKAQWEAL